MHSPWWYCTCVANAPSHLSTCAPHHPTAYSSRRFSNRHQNIVLATTPNFLQNTYQKYCGYPHSHQLKQIPISLLNRLHSSTKKGKTKTNLNIPTKLICSRFFDFSTLIDNQKANLKTNKQTHTHNIIKIIIIKKHLRCGTNTHPTPRIPILPSPF